MNLAAVVLIALTTTAGAASAQSVTYACVEERSVGWEPRDGQDDAIGRFAPSTAAKLMTFTPPEITDGKMARLGDVAVTEDGKTYTYTSNECGNVLNSAISDRIFGSTNDLSHYLAQCAERFSPDNTLRSVGYGSDMIRYYFTADPMTRESPIRYSLSIAFGIAMAHASQGTCTLVQ